MEKHCPCCDKHCPADQLHCPTGKKHFGIAVEETGKEHGHSAELPSGPDEKLLILFRKCGHFLHHNVGSDGDPAQLMQILTAEEKEILRMLLEKCLKNWESFSKN